MDAEEDRVLPHRSQLRFGSKLRSQPIKLRLFRNLFHPGVEYTKHPDRLPRTVLCNVLRNLLKVAGYKGR
jgi:hypothetical protein